MIELYSDLVDQIKWTQAVFKLSRFQNSWDLEFDSFNLTLLMQKEFDTHFQRKGRLHFMFSWNVNIHFQSKFHVKGIWKMRHSNFKKIPKFCSKFGQLGCV